MPKEGCTGGGRKPREEKKTVDNSRTMMTIEGDKFSENLDKTRKKMRSPFPWRWNATAMVTVIPANILIHPETRLVKLIDSLG